MNSSAHLSLETLVDIAEDRLPAGPSETAMGHVATCSLCNDKLRRLQHVLLLMKTDTAQDAPRDVLMSAINVFAPEPTATVVPRLVAVLTFDSRSARPAFGVRSLITTSRQLLYSAQDSDIDLRVRVQNQEFIITGQVIREGCSSGQVEIFGETGSTRASLNALCEFTLPPVPIGNYSLRVIMPDVEIEIPDLEL